MKHILVSWLGGNDMNCEAIRNGYTRHQSIERPDKIGPIASALLQETPHEAYILSNYPQTAYAEFHHWLSGIYQGEVNIRYVPMNDPMDLETILEASRSLVLELNEGKEEIQISYHISPGTSAMAVSLMICESSVASGRLIQSSKEAGVREFTLPMVMSVAMRERVDGLRKRTIGHLSNGQILEEPGFSDISSYSPVMKKVIGEASNFARFPVPVILLGENGTGKEVFAKSMHNASSQKDGPFVAVNCGAIPEPLLESELFGHVRGAFTGADKAKEGYIAAAHNGTLFLDEIGELSLSAQVKLLRVLQEWSIVPVGGHTPKRVDFRLIAATNRNILDEVRAGNFREDLFHRISTGIIHLPPLRERKEDIVPLVQQFLNTAVNTLKSVEPGIISRQFSPAAMKLLSDYTWPGNIREMQNTITRICLNSSHEIIDEESVRQQLLYASFNVESTENSADTSPLKIEQIKPEAMSDLDINKGLEELYRRYILEAYRQCSGNFTQMAELLNAGSYQNVKNWMKRYHIAAEEL